ncbi:MAG: glycosyltransferase [Saprospiraceae bacterium]|nr:glycosyltransferase [Saprospiraceae bacterium]
MEYTTCQFNDSYFPIMDGVGMTAHNYAHWLQENNVKSILAAPKVKNYKDDVDYKVYRFKSVQLPGMKPYRVGIPMVDVKFKKKIKQINFDLLHAHCPFVSGQFALKLAKKKNIPFVTTFHSKYRDDFKKIINNEYFINYMIKTILNFYNEADFVWVPNKATGNTLKEYGFKGALEIMPNGTDMEAPGKNKFQNYRKEGLKMIEADDTEFVMLFVGQHRWEKNVKLILEALKTLHNNKVKFKMIFVGEGYAAKEMKKLAKEFNLKDKVKFLGVITDRTELKKVYAASDLFVFPSIYDNSPLVMQEAAAFKIPSIVVAGSSSAENIIDGENGFTIENDRDSLVQKIAALIKDKQTIKKAGEGAINSIYHPWESIVKDVKERYVEIIKDHQYSNRDFNSIYHTPIHNRKKLILN